MKKISSKPEINPNKKYIIFGDNISFTNRVIGGAYTRVLCGFYGGVSFFDLYQIYQVDSDEEAGRLKLIQKMSK